MQIVNSSGGKVVLRKLLLVLADCGYYSAAIKVGFGYSRGCDSCARIESGLMERCIKGAVTHEYASPYLSEQ